MQTFDEGRLTNRFVIGTAVVVGSYCQVNANLTMLAVP